MKKITKCLIGILNMVSRVIIFFFFWWAFDDTGGPFKDKTLAFQNEYDVWQSRPFDAINQYYDRDSCPIGSIHIGIYNWPGMNEYSDNNGVQHKEIASQQFQKWTTTTLGNKPFILCGLQSKLNFINTANSSKSCSDRKLKECSGGSYCTSSDACPITTISLEEKTGGITTYYDPAQRPISLFRIDNKFVCLNQNVTNLFDGQVVDPHLKQQSIFQNCNQEDTEYGRLNTIDDVLYFQINNAENYQTLNNSYNKTLFYKRYTEFNSSCYGDIFNEVILIKENVSTMIDLSDSGYYASVIYLLLICYIFPGLPMVFRCFAPCQVEKLIGWDYLLRVVLTFFNVAYSIQVLMYNVQILSSIDVVKNSGCIQSFDKLDEVVSTAQDNVFLHILALAITAGLLIAELSVWLVIFCSKCLSKCYFFLKKQKDITKNIEQDQELQALQK